MPGKAKDVTPPDDDVIEGEAVEVGPGNDEDVIEAEVQRRLERSEHRGLSARPQRALILDDGDRMTVHGLIVANLGAQGLDVTPAEFNYFIRVCELRGVNPLFREAHFIKDRDGRITVQIGIDGFRKLSEDTGEYRGLTPAEWGEELYPGPVEAWIDKPNYVRVGVIREGFAAPVYGEAWLDEDGQTDFNGKPIGQWGKRTRTMLEKVAEVRARRKAFPRQLSGVYSDDEVPDPALRNVTPAGALPEGAPAPAGATESGAAPASGGWQPPEPPPAPEGHQGVVEEAVDGLRRVSPDSQAARKYGVVGPIDKVEVKFKVKGRKHTAMIFGELAVAVDALQIKAAEVVTVTGASLEEIEWNPEKPKKKELWGATDVAVLRDNQWVHALGAAPTLPLEEPAVDSSTGATATVEEAAPAAPDPTPEPASSPSPPPSSTSSTPPEPSTSSQPTTPAPTPSQPAPTTDAPPPLERSDETHVGGLPLVLTGPVEFRKPADKPVGILRCRYGEEVVSVALGDDPPGEVEKQLGTEVAPVYDTGDAIIVVGFWKNNWLVASAIGRHG